MQGASSAPLEAAPQVNPQVGQCSYWLTDKKRFCRGTVHRQSRFCGAHVVFDSSSDLQLAPGDKRVLCPVSQRHYVAIKDVKRHVEVCPDLRNVASQHPYYARGCNGGRQEELVVDVAESRHMDRRSGEARHFKELTEEELRALVSLVDSVYAEHVEPHLTRHHSASEQATPAYRAPRGSDTPTPYAAKQAPQIAALISVWRHRGLLPEERATAAMPPQLHRPTYLECAAGKGTVSLCIAETWAARGRDARGLPGTAPAPPLMFLVDRGGFRRKADSRVARAADGGEAEGTAPTALFRPFQRLRIDLRDLDVNRVPDLLASPQSTLVVHGKHLCGNCTDYAITAAVSGMKQRKGVTAIAIAPCCHHLAETRNLTYQVLRIEAYDAVSSDASAALDALRRLMSGDELGPIKFDLVASISAWAVMGKGRSTQEGEDEAAAKAKILTGRKAKRIVDWIRVLTLRALGMQADYVTDYVLADVTPENGLIVAQWVPPTAS